MLHNEARELLVEGYKKTGDAKAIAAVLESGEINHFVPGEKSQSRPDENRQSG